MRGKFAVSDLQISELRAAAPDRNDTPSKKIKNTIKYKNLPCSIEAPSAKWRSSHSRPALLVVQREAQSLSEAAERRPAPSAAPRPAERQIASGLQLHATHCWPISAIDFRREPWCGQIWIERVESGVCVFFFVFHISDLGVCCRGPLGPLMRQSGVKRGPKRRRHVLVHALVSYVFVKMASGVCGWKDGTLRRDIKTAHGLCNFITVNWYLGL